MHKSPGEILKSYRSFLIIIVSLLIFTIVGIGITNYSIYLVALKNSYEDTRSLMIIENLQNELLKSPLVEHEEFVLQIKNTYREMADSICLCTKDEFGNQACVKAFKTAKLSPEYDEVLRITSLKAVNASNC